MVHHYDQSIWQKVSQFREILNVIFEEREADIVEDIVLLEDEELSLISESDCSAGQLICVIRDKKG